MALQRVRSASDCHIALCWELGGGYGHLASLTPFVYGFIERGYQVHMISRDVCSAARFFTDAGISLHQAPFRHSQASQFKITPTFGHILHNVGYGDPHSLAALARAWRSLFEAIKPRLVVTEHAPTSLLAARTMGIPSVACGPGFFIPPRISPLPRLLRNQNGVAGATVDSLVLGNINTVLKSFGSGELKSISDLYSCGVHRMLLTFAELDHFPQRIGEQYLGNWPFRHGETPDWVTGSTKVIAYLKALPCLSGILSAIKESKIPAWVVCGDIPPDLRREYESPTLRISQEMANLECVNGSDCIGITNANIGTVTAMLLKGIPLISVPPFLEQLILARVVEHLGAGLTVLPEETSKIVTAIRCLIVDNRYRKAATSFAQKYQDFSLATYSEGIMSNIESNVGDFR